jgi:hypothetical protein
MWARLSGEETVPEEYVMVGGTKFVLNGKEIINHPHELKFATARRLGERLNVRTSENIFSLTLAQNRPHKYILKDSEQS